MTDRRGLGDRGEARATRELERRGYAVLEKNFRCRFGEIDIICQKGRMLVFVEVKYRGGSRFGAPGAAVDLRKQRRISNAASCYLHLHRCPTDTPCRFDVAEVSGQGVRLIENAFPYRGNFRG